MTFRAFWSGCWFEHLEPYWTHDHLTCQRCGTRIAVLPQAIVRGPRHDPEPVRGRPNIWAKQECPKVTKIQKRA